jgi:hypothetical protein
MEDQVIELTLRIDGPADGDTKELEALAHQLRDELLELPVHDVEGISGGIVPEGARAVGVAEVGALLVKFAPSLIGRVTRTVGAWLNRSIAHSIELEIGGDRIKLSAGSVEDQARLIALFEENHRKS